MEYQPVQYNGIVPDLKVPDFVTPFAQSQQAFADTERQEMLDLDRDQKTQLANLNSSFVDQTELMNSLAGLSKTVAEQTEKVRQQEKKNNYDDTFFKYYNMPQEELDAAAAAQQQQEQQLASEAEEATTKVNKVVQKEPVVSGALQQAMALSGNRRVAALNALTAARLEQYPQYLQDYVAARQPKTPAEYKAAQTEAMLSWANQTGMNQANEGFTSLHVTPKLRRYNASDSAEWTKGYNIQKGEDGRIVADNAISTGSIGINQYVTQVTSTIGRDGRTLVSNAQALNAINNLAKDGTLSTAALVKLGSETAPSTKKPWSEHPQFKGWVASARSYQLKKDREDRQIDAMEITKRFENAQRDNQSYENLAAQLRAEGYPADQVQSALTTFRGASIEQDLVRQGSDTLRNWLNANPGQKVPPEIWLDVPLDSRRAYQDQLAPDTTTESSEDRVRASAEFKALDKDVTALISAVDPTIPIQNDALGVTGAVNQEAFELDTKNWIANRTAQLMLSSKEPLDTNTALEQAKQEWLTGMQKLVQAKGIESFYKDGRFVPGMGPMGIHVGRSEAAANTARMIEYVNLNNVNRAMWDSDYEYRSDGNYSERVKLLSRKFGLRPIDIVNRGRSLKGMDPVSPTGTTESLTNNIQPADRARLNSVTNPTTQSLLRAQINSGQTLEGTPQQRTVALGRHLLTLGYGGIWQHEHFNYDSGYMPEGGQRVMQRSYPSAHNDESGGRALDFGLQANGEAKLDQLAYYLNKNKERFGISQVLWKTSGHYDHLHVELK